MSEPRKTYKVGYFVGSLSSTSINRVLSRSLIRLAPPDLEFTEIPIGDLPLYSQDYDSDYPPEARALKELLALVWQVQQVRELENKLERVERLLEEQRRG